MDKTKSAPPARSRAARAAALQPSETIPCGKNAAPADQASPPGLTRREQETARLAADGLYNQEIAERLGVSVNTVKTHLKKAYRKYGVSSRPELRQIMKK